MPNEEIREIMLLPCHTRGMTDSRKDGAGGGGGGGALVELKVIVEVAVGETH